MFDRRLLVLLLVTVLGIFSGKDALASTRQALTRATVTNSLEIKALIDINDNDELESQKKPILIPEWDPIRPIAYIDDKGQDIGPAHHTPRHFPAPALPAPTVYSNSAQGPPTAAHNRA